MGMISNLKREETKTEPTPPAATAPTTEERSDSKGAINDATKQAVSLLGLGVARPAIVDAICQRFVGLTAEQVEALVPQPAKVNPDPAPTTPKDEPKEETKTEVPPATETAPKAGKGARGTKAASTTAPADVDQVRAHILNRILFETDCLKAAQAFATLNNA